MLSTVNEENLPDVDDEAAAPYWSGTREGKIVVQSCTDCGYVRWPLRPLCPECRSYGVVWKELSPTGTLSSYATFHRALAPAFADDVPYTGALVELDDGPRMYGRLVDGDTRIEPGMPVRALFREIARRVTITDGEIDADRADARR